MGGADIWRFDQGDLDDDVVAIQQAAQARLAQIPPWQPEAAKTIREARAQGGGVYLSVDHSPRARVVEIPGPGGPITLRINPPSAPKGISLHFHGGRWFMLGADLHDPRPQRIADRARVTRFSRAPRPPPDKPHPP